MPRPQLHNDTLAPAVSFLAIPIRGTQLLVRATFGPSSSMAKSTAHTRPNGKRCFSRSMLLINLAKAAKTRKSC